MPIPPTHRPSRSTSGFTAIPRGVIDGLLTLSLARREIAVLLLVARLTYGCRDARWARIAHADLAAVGIGANHAGEVLRALLARGILERNGRRHEYRLGDLGRPAREAGTDRLRRLGQLVARQLQGSHFRNPALPETGGPPFPKREVPPSRNGNTSTVTAWRFDRSQGRFILQVEPAIDNERQ